MVRDLDHDTPVTSDCTFCRVLTGEVAAHVVMDSDDVLAFLDRAPLFPGHTLVVPRTHHETLTDVPVTGLEPLWAAVQRVAGAMTTALGAHGTFVAINNRVSQSVPHLHVHVVPRRFKDGLRGFFWPRQRYADDAEAAAVAQRIAAAL